MVDYVTQKMCNYAHIHREEKGLSHAQTVDKFVNECMNNVRHFITLDKISMEWEWNRNRYRTGYITDIADGVFFRSFNKNLFSH